MFSENNGFVEAFVKEAEHTVGKPVPATFMTELMLGADFEGPLDQKLFNYFNTNLNKEFGEYIEEGKLSGIFLIYINAQTAEDAKARVESLIEEFKKSENYVESSKFLQINKQAKSFDDIPDQKLPGQKLFDDDKVTDEKGGTDKPFEMQKHLETREGGNPKVESNPVFDKLPDAKEKTDRAISEQAEVVTPSKVTNKLGETDEAAGSVKLAEPEVISNKEDTKEKKNKKADETSDITKTAERELETVDADALSEDNPLDYDKYEKETEKAEMIDNKIKALKHDIAFKIIDQSSYDEFINNLDELAARNEIDDSTYISLSEEAGNALGNIDYLKKKSNLNLDSAITTVKDNQSFSTFIAMVEDYLSENIISEEEADKYRKMALEIKEEF